MPRLKITRKEQNTHRCTTVACSNAHRPHYHETGVELIIVSRLIQVLNSIKALAVDVTADNSEGVPYTMSIVPMADVQALIERELTS